MISMDLGLNGRRVLVTAGAGGIGRVIAERFRSEGARVAICDVDDAALADSTSKLPDLLAVRADVADSAMSRASSRNWSEILAGLTCWSTTPVSTCRTR